MQRSILGVREDNRQSWLAEAVARVILGPAGCHGSAMLNLLKSFLRNCHLNSVRCRQKFWRLSAPYAQIMSLSFFTRKMLACGFLAVASPVIAFGQAAFTPQGGESAIAGALPGDQVYPCAAINSNGGYLVWQDNAVTPHGLRIRAERLDSDLASAGPNFVVSAVAKAKTTGNQEKPKVALLNDGGAVFVWQGGKPGAQKIYARFLGAGGSFLTKDVRVSTHKKNQQSDGQVATLADGTVVVVWASDGQDGSMLGVFARRFSPTGSALGAEFQLNQFTQNNQRSPALAALANGGFVVAWISELQRGFSSVDVYARIFDASGAPVTDEFLVDTAVNHICANPAVAGSPQGGFAVAWSQNDSAIQPAVAIPANSQVQVPSTALGSITRSTNGWDVFACLFGPTGTTNSAPFRLNAYTYGDQFAPQISALGTNYMAVWSSLSQPDPQSNVLDPQEGVFGQFITGDGSPASGADLHVNTTVFGRQLQPVVASDGVSRFLVVWSSLITSGLFNFDLLAQQYQQSGGQ